MYKAEQSMNFHKKYNEYKTAIEECIVSSINDISCHEQLKAAVSYSLLAGGKRVRPVMFLACLEMLGANYSDYLSMAVAIECVHTYSLIHDDLPAMDNDDYRRGRLSNHKMFGEGMAILAGDALLNYAVELALASVKSEGAFNAVKYLFSASGISGMIDGQAYDLYYEDKEVENKEELLKILHTLKTGKLLTAPLVMASLIMNGKYLSELTTLGVETGILFQLSDDLLDVVGSFENLGKTLGKDSYAGKLTAISVYGEEQTKELINKTYSSIVKMLKIFDNNWFFSDFYAFMKNREK